MLKFVAPARTGAPSSRRVNRRMVLSGGTIAASLAGGLALLDPPLGLWPSFAELTADERTMAGQRRRFSPVDGVDVELNSRSAASRTGSGMGLDLISGEAFVSVAHRARRFRMTAGNATITAQDAAFNVQSDDESLCVTCISGSVGLSRGGYDAPLKAGREILFSGNETPRETDTDPNIRLAWRRGLLILQETSVATAIQQINRYFPGRLVLADSSKSAWPVTGVFHVDRINLAVVQLQRLLDLKATRLPGGVVLLG